MSTVIQPIEECFALDIYLFLSIFSFAQIRWEMYEFVATLSHVIYIIWLNVHNLYLLINIILITHAERCHTVHHFTIITTKRLKKTKTNNSYEILLLFDYFDFRKQDSHWTTHIRLFLFVFRLFLFLFNFLTIILWFIIVSQNHRH